jgi:hypothetical protein
MSIRLQDQATARHDAAAGDVATRPAHRTEPTVCDPSGTGVLRQRVRRVAAKPRLEAELRSIACDLLGPNEADETSAACAEWVATTTDATVSRVSDAALEALVRGLESVLVAAPPDVARHLERAKARAEAGFD